MYMAPAAAPSTVLDQVEYRMVSTVVTISDVKCWLDRTRYVDTCTMYLAPDAKPGSTTVLLLAEILIPDIPALTLQGLTTFKAQDGMTPDVSVG